MNSKQNLNVINDPHIWVQCENPQCMKWRKVSHCDIDDELKKVAWFCHMNPDKSFNICDMVQEEMHVPRGETVIFSELDLGTLVWAKMSGFPRWPAIITRDPADENADYVIKYQDGTNDPRYYHVEFLGNPHSHAWLSAQFIQVYTTSSADILFTERSMKFKKMKDQFQKSCLEASSLMKLSLEERLQKCVYLWQPELRKDDVLSENSNKQNSGKRDKRKKKHSKEIEESYIDQVSKHDVPKTMMVNINGTMYPVLFSDENTVSENNSFTDIPTTRNVSLNSTQSSKTCVVAPFVKDKKEEPESKLVKKKIKKVMKENIVYAKKYQNILKKNKPEIQKEQNVTIVNTDWQKHKTEPLTVFNDEGTFWKFYNDFCKSNNICEDVKHITWYNKLINLFQFFQKVHFVGGYKQAISHWKIWRNVCWDVIGNRKVDSQFLSLRKAYRQVLFNFERSMTKKEYQHQDYPNKSLFSDRSPVFPVISNSFINSPLSIPSALGLVKRASPYNIVRDSPSGLLVDVADTSMLVGVVPQLENHMLVDHGEFPSSNPDSPAFIAFASQGSVTLSTLSEIGLDVAIEELEDLDQQLGDLIGIDSQCKSFYGSQLSLCDESVPLIDEAELRYQPILCSQNVEELSDVMGELTDLEDTLLEMAGDTLSGFL